MQTLCIQKRDGVGMKDGWSNKTDTSLRTAKIHYFDHEKKGRSLCGMTVLTDRTFKSEIFVDIETYNKKKICQVCLKFKQVIDSVERILNESK